MKDARGLKGPGRCWSCRLPGLLCYIELSLLSEPGTRQLENRMGNPRVLACLLCALWDSAPGRRWRVDENDYWPRQTPSLRRQQNCMGILRLWQQGKCFGG